MPRLSASTACIHCTGSTHPGSHLGIQMMESSTQPRLLGGYQVRTSYLLLFISSCAGISRQLTLVIWVINISRQSCDLYPWASATVQWDTLPPLHVIRSKQLPWVSLVSARTSSFTCLTCLLSLPIRHLYSLNAEPSGSTSSYWCQGLPFVLCN